MPLEVEYKVSLHQSKHPARWNINKDKGAITFNLPLLYADARETIAKWRGYDCPDGSPCEAAIIDLFIECLIEDDILERVCIERAYQRIRMKGRKRCDPCCVGRVALLMAYPEMVGVSHGQ